MHRYKLASRHGAHNDMSDGMVINELCQPYEVEPDVFGNDIERATRRERAKDVMYGGYKRETGIRCYAAAAVERQDALGFFSLTADVALFYHATFRIAC